MFLKSDKKRKFSVYIYKSPTDSERVNNFYETYQDALEANKELYTEGAWLNRIYYKEKGYRKSIIVNEKENNRRYDTCYCKSRNMAR